MTVNNYYQNNVHTNHDDVDDDSNFAGPTKTYQDQFGRAPDNGSAAPSSSSSMMSLLSHYTHHQKLHLLNGADLWKLHPITGHRNANANANVASRAGASSSTTPAAAAAVYSPSCSSSNDGVVVSAVTMDDLQLHSIRLSDGPHGIRKPLSDFGLNDSHPATCFPSACATACSWSRQMLTTLGEALAVECHAHDVQVLLGPGINIKRYPAGGRNHEYFSEDPYLTGALASSYITGAQSHGVATCLKHYAVNNQESYRMVIDVVIDDRTLREIYLRAFEMCIAVGGSDRDGRDDQHHQKQQPRLVMAAYNQVNGTFCSENEYLLQTILRDEWKFDGVVVSDWGAVNDRAKGIQAGMDLEMPGNQGVCHDEFTIVPNNHCHQHPPPRHATSSTLSTSTTSSTTTTTSTTTPEMIDNPTGEGPAAGVMTTAYAGEGLHNSITRTRQQYLKEMYVDASAARVARLVQDYQPRSYHDSNKNANNHNSTDHDVERPAAAPELSAPGSATRPTHRHRMSLTAEDLNEVFDKHHKLAHDMATECIIMLQNRDNLLPISLGKSTPVPPGGYGPGIVPVPPSCNHTNPRHYRNIAVIGDFGKNNPRIQGMGSAKVTATRTTNVYDCLQHEIRTSSSSSTISFSPGYDVDGESDDIDQRLIDDATSKAREADVALVFVGLPEIMESEGFDRPHCRLPQQHISLVEAVCAVNSDVVVIISNGGVVTIPESFVVGAKAILEGFLLGQAGGSAIVDILLGKVSPSGKMPETIAVDTPHIPAHLYFPGTRHTVEYREGLDVGYRYFNKRHDSSTSDPDVVRFPFGHGLQYATFEYRNLKVAIQTDSKAKKRVVVSVDVQNTGTSHGAKEVIQLYVRAIGSAVYRPAHELKGFEKVYFSPGETKTVKFDLDERAFAFYDIGWKDWVVEHGLKCSFEIQIGTSSRDIRLRQTISFTSGQDASLLAQQSYPPVNDKSHQKVGGEYYVDDTTFSKRFGSSKLSVLDIISRTNEENVHEKIVHRNTLLKEASNVSWLGWVLFQFTYVMAISEVRRGPRRKREIRMIRANVENLPLRVLVLFAKGALTFRILDSLILLMNGFYLAALRSLFKRDRNYVRCLGQ